MLLYKYDCKFSQSFKVLVFTTFEYVKRIAMNTNILIFYFITLNLFWNSFRKGILKQQISDPTLLKSTQNYFISE